MNGSFALLVENKRRTRGRRDPEPLLPVHVRTDRDADGGAPPRHLDEDDYTAALRHVTAFQSRVCHV